MIHSIESKLYKWFDPYSKKLRMLKFKVIKLIVANLLYKLIKSIHVVSKMNAFVVDFFSHLHQQHWWCKKCNICKMYNPLYKNFFLCIKQNLLPFMCVCTCIVSNHMISQNIIRNVVCASSVLKIFVYAILYVYDSCLYLNILIFIFFWITLIHCGRNVSSKWIDAISVVRFCGWFAYQEITLLIVSTKRLSVRIRTIIKF